MARRYNGRAVNENGQPPPRTLVCGRCATAYDPDDKFCRQCGLSLHDAPLPALRNGQSLPAVWRPPLPAPVLRAAAFVAAGKVAEIAVRGLARRVLRRGPTPAKAGQRREQALVSEPEALQDEEAQVISETLLMRRIRFRR